MELGDIVRRVVIDPRKLTHYALDPDSPRGRDKALLFAKLLGIFKADSAFLIGQLEEKALRASAYAVGQDRFGTRYRADVSILGKAGQTQVVRTGWLVPLDSQEAYLVTIFIRKG